MSDYILLPNGDTVRGDELYHWKYIKREKVGGKWRYYYDTEELKKDVKTFVKDPTGIKRKKEFEKSIVNVKNTRRNIDESMNAAYRKQDEWGRYGERFGNKSEATRKAGERWLESANKAIEKFDDDDVATKEYTAAKDAYLKSPLGKLDRALDYGIDVVNKMTGNDYRKAMNSAARELRTATDKHEKAKETLKRAESMSENNKRSENPDVWRSTLDRELHRATVHELDTWLDKDNAAEKYMATRAAYLDTPLGKLEIASDKVERWLDSALNRKRRKR